MIVGDRFFCICAGDVEFSERLIAPEGGDALSIGGAMVHLEGSSHKFFCFVEFLGGEVFADLREVDVTAGDVVIDLGARP